MSYENDCPLFIRVTCYNPPKRGLSKGFMRRSLLLLILLVLLPVSAHAEPPTLAAYRQQVAAAYAAAQRSNRIDLDTVAAELAQVSGVALDDGTVLPTNNGWLREALAEEPPDYPRITARLGAILDALGQNRTPPPADALEKLPQVFEVPPFKDREIPSAFQRGWTAFWGWIGDMIGRFFRWLLGDPSTSGPGVNRPAPAANSGWAALGPWGTALLIASILLVGALLWYAIRGVRSSLVSDAKVRAKAAAEEDLNSTQALDRAQIEARDGDYRGAVRSLYIASLLWLHEQRLLRYDRSLTNREYLRQLEGQPLQGQLAPIVETFDQVWYGKQPLSAEEFTAYQAQVTTLRDRERSA